MRKKVVQTQVLDLFQQLAWKSFSWIWRSRLQHTRMPAFGLMILALLWVVSPAFLSSSQFAPIHRNASSHALEIEGLEILAPSSGSEAEQATDEPQPEPQNATRTPQGAAVILGGRTLFSVEASIGTKSRAERAAEASKAIRAAATNRQIPLEDFQIRDLPNSGVTQILAGSDLLLAVTQADANVASADRETLARQHLEEIKDGVIEYRETRSPQKILTGLGKTAIATLIFALLFSLINRLFRGINQKIESTDRLRIRTLRLGSREILSAQQVIRYLTRFSELLRVVSLLALISIFINTVLSFFPATQSVSIGIFSSIFSVVSQLFWGFLGYLPKLIFLIILGIAAIYLMRFSNFVFSEVERGDLSLPGFDRDWAVPTARIAQILILALFAVIAFPYLPGAGSDAFQGISIFLGILISLGSSSAISNIIAGILLTYTRAFKIGDEVEIGDVSGTVVEKGLLVTRILTDKNYYSSIPNAEVLGSTVTNLRQGGVLRGESDEPPMVFIEVGFRYDLPWQTAHEILIEAAKATKDVLPEPMPFVRNIEFAEQCVIYEINVFTDNVRDNEMIESDLRRNIQEKCYEMGVELAPLQQFTVVRRNSKSSPTLPRSLKQN